MTIPEQNKRLADLSSSGFFVLRTPLLPVDEFLRWSESVTTGPAQEVAAETIQKRDSWQANVQLLRAQLREIVDRPEILHALFVASPALESSIGHWKRDPDSKKGIQAERALVRYFARMASRATPFGLFSGCSLGWIATEKVVRGAQIALESREKYRPTSRLDFDYLFALTTALARDPTLAGDLLYWSNSSLRRVGDTWHYVESRMTGSKRSHHLVKLYCDPHLNALIERSWTGASIPDLIETLLHCPESSDISEDEARTYVHELIESQVLVTTLTPLVSGEPLDDMITQLESLPNGNMTVDTLRWTRDCLAKLDAKGFAASPADYRTIASKLQSLPAPVDLTRLFQVDLIKPLKESLLGTTVTQEAINGVQFMSRLGQTTEPEELRTFREAFRARYERAWVPLIQALDEDAGIGFGMSTDTDSSPLLRGLQLAGRKAQNGSGLGAFHLLLLRKILDFSGEGSNELSLEASDLPSAQAIILPDSFSVMFTVVAPSFDAIHAGDFRIHLRGAVGPSGARFIGRFCHADPELERQVRSHLREEEAHEPDAVYAEIIHLPEGRLGNVLCRPVLRDYEITYLGRSGAAEDMQLSASDLLVSVSEDARIILYSRRLRRRIIPRLSNAHGFVNQRLASVYRFLCTLQQQATSLPMFSWGPLDKLETLPRIRAGRVVLAPARWRLSSQEIKSVDKPDRKCAFLAVQELKNQRKLPRWVMLAESDQMLLTDLDNPLSVDALVHLLKRMPQAILHEMYPSPEEMCITGPEGRFSHEFMVPLVRVRTTESKKEGRRETMDQALARAELQVNPAFRTSPPGSEWFYVKLYGGIAALDDVLTATMPPFLASTFQLGLLTRWFFIRYADPHHHLRIRFQIAPDRPGQELPQLVSNVFNPLVVSGKLWRIEFDTYEREVERYGGEEGMLIAEEIFFADSEAVLEVLRELEGDHGLDVRWRIAVLGVDRLLSDIGLDMTERRAVIERLRDSFHRDFQVGAFTKRQLGDKFRAERRKLEMILDDSPDVDPLIDVARKALARRSDRVTDAVRRLRSLEGTGKLYTRISDLVASYVHMHINRVIRSNQRTHELVLYDFLFRVYDGKLARQGKTHRVAATAKLGAD